MLRSIPHLVLILFLTTLSRPVWSAVVAPVATVIVDEEYDRYKKRGDEFFKAGNYTDARRQYQNCLLVPGFENDTYAKAQIEKCGNALALRQQADDALKQNKVTEAIGLFNQVLAMNPDDAITKSRIADYYEREGNQLYSQQKYAQAKELYTKALQYTPKQEILRIQIRNCDENLVAKPNKKIGLKLLAGAVAVGSGAYAIMLRSDYQSKLSELNRISQAVDPENTGIIANSNAYQQYDDAYNDAESARQKTSTYKVLLGVAAVATITEIYLLLHKPKPRTGAKPISWYPASHSLGLAISYTF
ncbi:tetratricopeptide TPR_2 repeat protein [Fibrisoma limi BUZ 3]|uniref:Tetratricopeptide TPR_2 repeat protein n=1 Tax=Fibrisoma limi BUZ 3 TaxID=1185876 RepID=I2GJS6_9BACT|nr:tetratricopeptide repeat protein [Fibrisoma limi]CCH54151.1 tetratricopeptide TPR_2 repeat protein [Fibrisoma limi BUZ 3]